MFSSKKFIQKLFILSLLLLSFSFLILIFSFKPKLHFNNIVHVSSIQNTNPKWFDVISKQINITGKINVGYVNYVDHHANSIRARIDKSTDNINIVQVRFNRVSNDKKWEDFFPEWIDEDEKWGPPTCPEIPLAEPQEYEDLFDVIVAGVPCIGNRDVFGLQVNLVVANLAVAHRPVYVVFIGKCGPMVEIFRVDDVVEHVGDYWVYKPELRRLKQKVLMPFGSCQIAPPFAETGKEVWRNFMSQSTKSKPKYTTYHHQREAYVTVLHSSESYVCGAIALAQSIIQSNSTKDLILLHDKSIRPNSLRGLRAAGWKTRCISRIRSPFSIKNSYNEWNYSKLRIWQLTTYDKVIFIDSDLLVLKNIDNFFAYPQLSAAGNDMALFNSGVMVIEPSIHMFEELMLKSFQVVSYNGGDQGFLNEVFTWWHRLPSKINHLKIFGGDQKHDHPILNDVFAIHYLGFKPWVCYKDYDCNWDKEDHHIFASDLAHKKWWQVYDSMPKKLQKFCGLTQNMNARIKKWRKIARNGSSINEHWKIKVRDPRQYHLVK